MAEPTAEQPVPRLRHPKPPGAGVAGAAASGSKAARRLAGYRGRKNEVLPEEKARRAEAERAMAATVFQKVAEHPTPVVPPEQVNLQAAHQHLSHAMHVAITHGLMLMGFDAKAVQNVWGISEPEALVLMRRSGNKREVELALARDTREVAVEMVAKFTSEGVAALQAELQRISRLSRPDPECEFCNGRGFYGHPKSGAAVDCRCCIRINSKDIMLLQKQADATFHRNIEFLERMKLLTPMAAVDHGRRNQYQQMLDRMTPEQKEHLLRTGEMPAELDMRPIPVEAEVVPGVAVPATPAQVAPPAAPGAPGAPETQQEDGSGWEEGGDEDEEDEFFEEEDQEELDD